VATSLSYPAAGPLGEVHALARAAVSSLGLTDGPGHVELIVTADGPRLVEMGARGGGGHVFSTIVEAVSGVPMVRESARVLAGDEPDLVPKHERGCVYRLFVPQGGVIRAIRGVEEARAMPGVLDGTNKLVYSRPASSAEHRELREVPADASALALRDMAHVQPCDCCHNDRERRVVPSPFARNSRSSLLPRPASYSTCAQVYPCVETYPCPPLGYGGQGYVSVPAVGEIDESQRPSPLTLEEKKLLLNLLGNISRSLDTGSPQTDPGVRQDLKALRQKLAPAGAKTETDKK